MNTEKLNEITNHSLCLKMNVAKIHFDYFSTMRRPPDAVKTNQETVLWNTRTYIEEFQCPVFRWRLHDGRDFLAAVPLTLKLEKRSGFLSSSQKWVMDKEAMEKTLHDLIRNSENQK